jgi:LCP family protein required for cell wall assembly
MAESSPEKPRKQRRTWPQRLTIFTVVIGAFACFTAAGVIAGGQWVLSQRKLAPLAETTTQRNGASPAGVVVPDLSSSASDDSATATLPTLPSSTVADQPLVLAEPDAANFLVVGADNGDCGDDPLIEDRSDLGERSDTIMVWRANPKTNELAVLSFPRDLYVEFPSGRRNRINAAFKRDDPSELQEVLNLNFGVQIDHYIQIDFCAFRRLVQAVGGVEIPFQYPARDKPSNGNPPLFLVEQTGCVNLDGDTALAYVRSRHYQYEDPAGSGNWVSDPTSDFGRISRQQDFLRRVLAKVIDNGLYDPDVARALITANSDYIVTDPDLTLRRELEFANSLKNFDPGAVTTYRIDSTSKTLSDGAQVEIPQISGDNMQAILAIFRGEATLASAPEQQLATTTTIAGEAAPPATEPTGDQSVSAEASLSADATSPDPAAGTTLPAVSAEENNVGIAPDRSVTCD